MKAARSRKSGKHEAMGHQVHRFIAEKLNSRIEEQRSKAVIDRNALGKLLSYHASLTHIYEKELFRLYLPELEKIERCIGSELSSSIYHGELEQFESISHLELSLYVALLAIDKLNSDTKLWGVWSGRTDSVHVEEQWRLSWLLTMFRCALALPIGYMVSHTSLQARDVHEGDDSKRFRSWQPGAEDMDEFIEKHGEPTVRKSNRRLSPRLIAFSTYFRLFDRAPASVPMLSLAEADFFSERRDPSNPLLVGLDHAMRHIFIDEPCDALPYWWVLAINDHFARNEAFTPIKLRIKEGYGQPWEAKKKVPQNELHPEPSSQPEAREIEAPDEEQEGEAGAAADTTPPLPAILRRALHLTRDKLESGDFTVNRPGARLHSVDSRTYLVVPVFWKIVAGELNHAAASPEQLATMFAEHGIVEVIDGEPAEFGFAVKPGDVKKRIGKVKAVALTNLGQDYIHPGTAYETNEDLRPIA